MEKCLQKNSNIKLKKTFRKTKCKVCVYNANRGELVSFSISIFSPPKKVICKLCVLSTFFACCKLQTYRRKSMGYYHLRVEINWFQIVEEPSAYRLLYHIIISWWGVCSVSIICFVIFPLSIYAHFSTCCSSLWAYRYQVSNGTQ